MVRLLARSKGSSRQVTEWRSEFGPGPKCWRRPDRRGFRHEAVAQSSCLRPRDRQPLLPDHTWPSMLPGKTRLSDRFPAASAFALDLFTEFVT